MIDLTMNAYKRGERVILHNPRHNELAGLRGAVRRAIKSRGVFEIKLDDGRFYDARPETLRPLCTCHDLTADQCPNWSAR